MHRRIREILVRISPALAPAKPFFEWVAEAECTIASAWTKSAHKRLMSVQCGIPPAPENFDHQIDQFYWWAASRNHQWVERGVYGALALTGGNLLELCCGDGFNARNFYSLKSKQVVACDIDSKIISVAKRKNAAPNVSFHIADIRTEMPAGLYDNIVWDAAIDYFTELEILSIMQSIKDRLSTGGILIGHTAIERGDRQHQLSHHKYRFKHKEDLLQFLAPFFANVLVFETEYPGRHNLYFWASDSVIPFGDAWTKACRKRADNRPRSLASYS